jgi:Trk K+ transport system NAD-binding subunit
MNSQPLQPTGAGPLDMNPAITGLLGHVILLGSGRLAFQVGRRLKEKSIPFVPLSSEFLSSADKPVEKSIVEQVRETLQEAGIKTAAAVYLLDDQDRYNIQMALIVMSLTKTTPIIVSLFNAEIAAQLQAGCPQVIARNPALAATEVFINSLYAPLTRKIRPQAADAPTAQNRWWLEFREHFWLYGLATAFLLLLMAGTIVFHFSENLSWIDAFYFSGTIMTTTGFGDISLRNSQAWVKVFGVALMVNAVVLASLTFSFVADRLFKRRSEMALGHKKHGLNGHVIVCGLGRVGYQVVRELLRRKEKVLVIEKNPEERFLQVVRGQGARILVGDASIPGVLDNAGVNAACGLFSVINDDLKNLEIGLNARSLRPDLRLILRIFDKEIADEMRDALDIHFALSSSAIAADEFVRLLQNNSSTGQHALAAASSS